MIQLLLAAALVPSPAFCQVAKTGGLAVEPAAVVETAALEPEFEYLLHEHFNELAAVEQDMYFPGALDAMLQIAENDPKPARRAAAVELLRAASRGVPEGTRGPLAVANWLGRRYESEPGVKERFSAIDEKFASVERYLPARVAPAEPPAPISTKAAKLRAMIRMSFPDAGSWEQERNIHQRGAEALEDRDSELASYYPGTLSNLPLLTEWTLSRALDRVKDGKIQPLVAATIINHAARRLDEPAKAQLMLRFADANLHPDFSSIVTDEERRATATAVEALFAHLGWGSTPVEQAVLRHVGARLAGNPAPAASALPAKVEPSGQEPGRGLGRGMVLATLGAAFGIAGWNAMGLLFLPLCAVILGLAWWAGRPRRLEAPVPPEIAEGLDEIERYLEAHDVEKRIRVLEEKSSIQDTEEIYEEVPAERLTPPRKVR